MLVPCNGKRGCWLRVTIIAGAIFGISQTKKQPEISCLQCILACTRQQRFDQHERISCFAFLDVCPDILCCRARLMKICNIDALHWHPPLICAAAPAACWGACTILFAGQIGQNTMVLTLPLFSQLAAFLHLAVRACACVVCICLRGACHCSLLVALRRIGLHMWFAHGNCAATQQRLGCSAAAAFIPCSCLIGKLTISPAAFGTAAGP